MKTHSDHHPLVYDTALLRRSWESWISTDMQRAGPYWLQLVWTALFALALALVFTLLGFLSFARTPADWLDPARWLHWLGNNLVGCFIIAYLIHGMFEAAGWLIGGPARVRQLKGWRQVLFFAGVPLLGVALGWPLSLMLVSGRGLDAFTAPMAWRVLAWGLGLSLLTTFFLYHWFGAKARALDAERKATQAQLRLLQAQMEPHFLFNTLANVHALVDHDPPKAKAMLGAFTDYLRASLAKMRSAQLPLADELDMAQAYLEVQALRMDDRLHYRIEADAAVRRLPVPPLLLQPLVENAVLHGVEPQVQGGEVVVSARLEQGLLVLEVSDSGRGLQAAPRHGGAGLALANLRQRLLVQFGQSAALELQGRTSGGTVARLRLPLQEAS